MNKCETHEDAGDLALKEVTLKVGVQAEEDFAKKTKRKRIPKWKNQRQSQRNVDNFQNC